MATIVFGSLGSALGGPVGGALGTLAGRRIDQALLGGASGSRRLRELEVSLSTYGQPIARHYGRMRAAGAVIWATELQEHEGNGGGKAQGGATAYTYTVNLAVAVSSRPIAALGRIWADGRLLRGAAGDLKVGGILRLHTGAEDQEPDPLIAASEGLDRCPAFRGIAYAVFEELDLSSFGNRVPALTFEVIADEHADLAQICGDALVGCEVMAGDAAFAGLSIEDTLADLLTAIDPVMPVAVDGGAPTLTVRIGSDGHAPVLLGAAAVAVADDAFGRSSGFVRRTSPAMVEPPPALRYFDIARDYQPSVRHAAGRALPGQPAMIDLPVSLAAGDASALVEQTARYRARSGERAAWRTCDLDPAVAPGVQVRLPDQPGLWRVEAWEWREAGIELELVRTAAFDVTALPAGELEPFPTPPDLILAPTSLIALELPWDGEGGAPDRPRPVAAVGAEGPGWRGAALYVDRGDGQLRPLGAAGRRRALIGTVAQALPPASPLLLDRAAQLTVKLVSTDQAPVSTDMNGLAMGANLALVGAELIRFASAEPMGAGVWRLSSLLRGCDGTEAAIAGHVPGESFALLDERLTALDPALVASGSGVTIAVLGLGDGDPVAVPLGLAGLARRPLAPVHPRVRAFMDGSIALAWTRRARGGWCWHDEVDVPLVEERETYDVTYEHAGVVLRSWSVDGPTITLPASELDPLGELGPGGSLSVRQRGTHALSSPLFLTALA